MTLAVCLRKCQLSKIIWTTAGEKSRWRALKVQAADYIKMSRTTATGPFSGQDVGYLTGSAEPTSCTKGLLTLPANHD
jgi:hypothetical protein